MDLRSVAPNARAAVFAAVCTLLAVAAHRLMSGTGIPVAAQVFGAVAVFCFARIAAALGERGLGSIALLVGGSQIGLHLLFHAVQAPTMSAMPGMGQISGNSSGMTIAHILAAATAAWWLRRGEAALFAAVERARVVLGASWRMVAWWAMGTRPIRSAPPAVPAFGPEVCRPAAARALLFTVIRRGPPPASGR
ncbi:hypothetical protein ABIA35_005254 [Catenulispora sp. MAP12-49]|uniref:hypothetical protein n=1 Tax=Catenulispora sp. MAP12-49 TaxID=3156302 RepID=UPI00351561AA